jgi:hypothetical protein
LNKEDGKFVLIENIWGIYGRIWGTFDTLEEAQKEDMRLSWISNLSIEYMSEDEIKKGISEGKLFY